MLTEIYPSTQLGRRWLYTFLVITIFLACLLSVHTAMWNAALPKMVRNSAHLLKGSSHHSSDGKPFIGASPIVVGRRHFEPQYYGKGCSSTQLLGALKKARIRADGASLKPSQGDFTGDNLDLSDFEFSWDLPGCPKLHKYSAAEACDLVKAFGGFILRGDSYMRHVNNALFLLLTGRNDGAVAQHKERCRGDTMFHDADEHVKACRNDILWRLDGNNNNACGGDMFLEFRLSYTVLQHNLTAGIDDFLTTVRDDRQYLSPIILSGYGLHSGLNIEANILGIVRPLIARYQKAFPRPVSVWMGLHAPGANKPKQHLESQGPAPTRHFNDAVERAIHLLSPGEMTAEDGAMVVADWYGATDSAWSYDGTHYSYQVNMEKAIFILNLLDVIWGEAVAAGGQLLLG